MLHAIVSFACLNVTFILLGKKSRSPNGCLLLLLCLRKKNYYLVVYKLHNNIQLLAELNEECPEWFAMKSILLSGHIPTGQDYLWLDFHQQRVNKESTKSKQRPF